MRIDGGFALRLAALALFGGCLFVVGSRMPSDTDYTRSARVEGATTIGESIRIVPSDLEPAYSRAYAEAVASRSRAGDEPLAVIDSWLGYYDGLPEDARGLVYVVALDPGAGRYECYAGPAGLHVKCPNYRTTEVIAVVSAITGDWVFSRETAEPYPFSGVSSTDHPALP